MKPTRNRFFCIAAKRTKMLFESESQANNFIRFNAGEMEELGGKVPVRSYYCPLCMGWHVTSNPNVEYFEKHRSHAEIVMETILEEKAEKEITRENKVFDTAADLVGKNLLEDAIRTSLNGYHLIKNDNSGKDTAELLLKKAFDTECLLVNQILEGGLRNDPTACKPAKKCLRILKRAAENCEADFNEYIETLSSIVGGFPNETKSQEVEAPVELTSEQLEEKENARKLKAERKLEKRFREFRRDVSSIYAYMVAGQRSESLRKIRKCTEEAQSFTDCPQFREQLIECIDSLMKYRKMFDEIFPEEVKISAGI